MSQSLQIHFDLALVDHDDNNPARAHHSLRNIGSGWKHPTRDTETCAVVRGGRWQHKSVWKQQYSLPI